MSMRATPTTRRGYSLMLAMVFNILMLALLSLAYRQLGSTLRIETARVQQIQRDEGRLRAAARALALLETGVPRFDPYVRKVHVDTSEGPSDFIITITSEGSGLYSVQATKADPNDPTPTIDDNDTPGLVPLP
jgi:hypothetical protein